MNIRVLLFVLSVGTSSAATAAEPLTVVQDGRSGYSIVVSSEASPSERHGAEEVRTHVKQLSGAVLPVVTDAQALPATAILVGRSKYTDAIGIELDEKKLGPDGFVLKTTGKHLVVAGSRVRGTMYGCTTLLEKLGVRWFTPKVTHVP